jgi:hypothetical protein
MLKICSKKTLRLKMCNYEKCITTKSPSDRYRIKVFLFKEISLESMALFYCYTVIMVPQKDDGTISDHDGNELSTKRTWCFWCHKNMP